MRISTDLLMVNPNKGFKWHQDNQNGPLVSGHGGPLDALRFWVTMDDTPADYGAPVYLRKSHLNKCVGKDDVFVNVSFGPPALRRDHPSNFLPGILLLATMCCSSWHGVVWCLVRRRDSALAAPAA